ncbi:MAG TPA: hypothetical protein VNI77_04605 [Nitrososphaera sp.]|nr:hypothetical protein [Nitrososphaera sp.]
MIESTKTTLGIIGTIGLVAVIFITAMTQLNQAGDAAPDIRCLPSKLSDIPSMGFPIRQPDLATISPNAQLRAIDQNRDLVKLYYADFSMCPFDESRESMIQKGAIDVTVYRPGITLKNSTEFQQQELEYAKSNPDMIIADVQPIKVNGYNGVGWEPYESKSVVRINGQEVESTPIPAPGVVRFYNDNDGTIYSITANRPLADILKIAESIQ